MTPVYRAPMRSRRDDVDAAGAVERALTHRLCGVGEPRDERAERRLERFVAVPDGAFVWTRDGDGDTFLGRLTGPARRDPGGADVDLVHVRPCEWAPTPVDDAALPPAVTQTFDRGGRNFQQINPGDVEAETAALWERLTG